MRKMKREIEKERERIRYLKTITVNFLVIIVFEFIGVIHILYFDIFR